MRRLQQIRRRRFSGLLFFAAFSWAGIGMGVDVKSGFIAKDFSAFLENKLNTIFVDKAIRLSGVEAGAFNKLAIKDFTVFRKTDSSPLFSVDKIIIKYNLLNLALRQFERSGEVYLISPSFFIAQDQLSLGDRRDKNVPPIQGVGGVQWSDRRDFPVPPLQLPFGSAPLRCQILNGSINVFGKKPILKNLEGQVVFSGSNLKVNNVKGRFLNLPVLVNGSIDNVLEAQAPFIKLRFLAKEKYYAATCTFKNDRLKGDLLIWGRVRLFDKFDIRFKGSMGASEGGSLEIKRLVVASPFGAKDGFSLSGDINLFTRSGKFIAAPRAGSGIIKLLGSISEKKGLSVYAKVSHINFFGSDLLAHIDVNAGIYKIAGGQGLLKGALKTQNLILNYRPFKEVEANWILKGKELFITNLELKDGYRLFGKLRLTKPYDVEMTLSINNADLADWLTLSQGVGQGAFSGTLSGRLNTEGPLGKLVTNGKLNIRDGNINDIRFEAINFNIKGKGPLLTISDSRILKEGGFLYVDGEVDLAKLGKRNLLEDIRIETDQKVVVWDGWDIAKSQREIAARKDLGEEFGINFRTYINTGGIEEDQKRSELGLDYKLKKDDSINLRMKDDSTFVGVEHRVKF